MDVNTASGFVAQYTTRQEYRFARDLFDEEQKNGALGDSGKLVQRVVSISNENRGGSYAPAMCSTGHH